MSVSKPNRRATSEPITSSCAATIEKPEKEVALVGADSLERAGPLKRANIPIDRLVRVRPARENKVDEADGGSRLCGVGERQRRERVDVERRQSGCAG